MNTWIYIKFLSASSQGRVNEVWLHLKDVDITIIERETINQRQLAPMLLLDFNQNSVLPHQGPDQKSKFISILYFSEEGML